MHITSKIRHHVLSQASSVPSLSKYLPPVLLFSGSKYNLELVFLLLQQNCVLDIIYKSLLCFLKVILHVSFVSLISLFLGVFFALGFGVFIMLISVLSTKKFLRVCSLTMKVLMKILNVDLSYLCNTYFKMSSSLNNYLLIFFFPN